MHTWVFLVAVKRVSVQPHLDCCALCSFRFWYNLHSSDFQSIIVFRSFLWPYYCHKIWHDSMKYLSGIFGNDHVINVRNRVLCSISNRMQLTVQLLLPVLKNGAIFCLRVLPTFWPWLF